MTRSPSSSSAVVSVLERGVNTWPVELGDPWAFERPAYSVVPDWDYTLGPEVSDLCDFLRFTPDAEQEMIIDAAFGVKDELPAAAEGAVKANVERKEAQAAAMKENMVRYTKEILRKDIRGQERIVIPYNPQVEMIVPEWVKSA